MNPFRRRPHSDFSAELQAHLELEQDRLRAEGFSEAEAYNQARKNLGNLTKANERFYESSRWIWLDQGVQDTRLALRHLRMAPAFAVTAILTLALGIGVTTAVFTLVHAVILKPLPVSSPSQLYRLGKDSHCCVFGGYSQGSEFSIVSYELYRHFIAHTKGFEELAAFQSGGTALGVQRAGTTNPAESHRGEFVSGNYFTMFGVGPYAGRMLTAADDQPGAPPVAVLTYGVWERKFGRDPSVIGATFIINAKPFAIVGVTPPGFYGGTLRNTPPEYFLPLATEPLINGEGSFLGQPNLHWLALIGRIQAGTPVAALQAQMRVQLQQWLRSHLADMNANERTLISNQTLYLTPGGSGISSMKKDYAEWLLILLVISGFMLLIVCANVAGLMLVRGMERRQQISLSMALGARPARLIRQALTESSVISLLGGAAGIAVAFVGARLLLYSAFPTAADSPIDATPSLPVLLFALGIAAVTGVAFGIAPAWMALRTDPMEALRGANRTTRRAGSLPRQSLVIGQAALSLVLLSASGLLIEALRKLERQDSGFEKVDRLVVNFDARLAGYQPAKLETLYRDVIESLRSLPGVTSVALASYSPQNGDSWSDNVFVNGRSGPGANGPSWVNRVTPEYFETIGNSLVNGRAFTRQDVSGSLQVAVINEAFAKIYFKNEDPIGRHFGNTPKDTREYEVVGVVKDTRHLTSSLDKPVPPFYFLPSAQFRVNSSVGELRSHYMSDIVIRMRPGAILSHEQVRRALASVDPKLPIIKMQRLGDQVASNYNQQRLIARLTSFFGVLALILTAIGIYGVTAYSVGSRTNEIGLRIALGADQGAVLALVLRGAVVLIGFGLVLGVPLSLAAGQLLGSQLYGINPLNPVIILAAVFTLGLSGLIAAFIPAFRASCISPIKALRTD